MLLPWTLWRQYSSLSHRSKIKNILFIVKYLANHYASIFLDWKMEYSGRRTRDPLATTTAVIYQIRSLMAWFWLFGLVLALRKAVQCTNTGGDVRSKSAWDWGFGLSFLENCSLVFSDTIVVCHLLILPSCATKNLTRSRIIAWTFQPNVPGLLYHRLHYARQVSRISNSHYDRRLDPEVLKVFIPNSPSLRFIHGSCHLSHCCSEDEGGEGKECVLGIALPYLLLSCAYQHFTSKSQTIDLKFYSTFASIGSTEQLCR